MTSSVAANAGAPSRVALFMPSLAGGGAERVMVNIASGFADRGFETDLVVASAEGPNVGHMPASVGLVELRSSRVIRSLAPLSAYLRHRQPHALIAALNHANLVAMIAARTPRVHTRVVITIHNHFSKELAEDGGYRDRIIKRALGTIYHWADAIVAVSDGVAEDFARLTKVPRERIQVIYNPVITPALLRAAHDPVPHPWFADAGRPVILGVGRLTRQKNFTALVEAFAMIRDHHPLARLVILGEGPERATIQACVTRHNLQDSVSMPGFVKNPYACMARAAVLVLSSDWEGLPTVLIESLALGTPVVSTDCPSGPREILENGTAGQLVPCGDAAALAGAVCETIQVGRASVHRDALRRFMPDVVLDQYEAICGLNGARHSGRLEQSLIEAPSSG